MSVLNVTNNGTRWRVFEKEWLERHLGDVTDLTIGNEYDINSYSNIEYVFWRPNTEESKPWEIKWMIDLCNKLPNCKHINSPKYFLNYHGKDYTFNIWKSKNIPHPKYISYESFNDFNRDINFSTPMLVRVNNMCSGRGSFLVKTEDELNKKATELETIYNKQKLILPTTNKMAVEFIDVRTPENYNMSYRVIVSGNKIITGYARLSQSNDWVAITGKFKKEMAEDFVKYQKRCDEICKTYEKEIINSVHSLGLDLQGVDIIEDKNGKIYILEVQPGFSCGYPEWGGPFYNPNYPELVNFLTKNKKRLIKEIPFYYLGWLNKESLFDNIFFNLKMHMNNKKQRKKLYCDIDSTINNHWERVHRWSNNGECNWSKALSREEIMKDEVLPGAKETLERLSDKYEIHFLTARNFADAYNITKDWLDLKGFKYESINVVKKSKDKPEFLELNGSDLFIDDLSAGQERGPSYVNLYTETISDLESRGLRYIIFKGDWNDINE